LTGVDGPYYEVPLLSSGNIYKGGIVRSICVTMHC
jgi:hypothetical protein